jgi:hypothetical protein
MVLYETCGSLVTRADGEKNEANRDRCPLCVKMDLHAEEAKKFTGVPCVCEDRENVDFVCKCAFSKKKVKKCSVSDEHVRRRTQWTTLRGNPWRSLAWTDESSDEEETENSEEEETENSEEEEIDDKKAERKANKKARMKAFKEEKLKLEQEQEVVQKQEVAHSSA